MNIAIERVSQLESWLTNAGICCDCGAEIHHYLDEPFASCSGCGRDFGEWTSDPPTIQRLRMALASTQGDAAQAAATTQESDMKAQAPHGNALLTPEQRAEVIAAANATPDVVRRSQGVVPSNGPGVLAGSARFARDGK